MGSQFWAGGSLSAYLWPSSVYSCCFGDLGWQALLHPCNAGTSNNGCYLSRAWGDWAGPLRGLFCLLGIDRQMGWMGTQVPWRAAGSTVCAATRRVPLSTSLFLWLWLSRMLLLSVHGPFRGEYGVADSRRPSHGITWFTSAVHCWSKSGGGVGAARQWEDRQRAGSWLQLPAHFSLAHCCKMETGLSA